MGYIRLSPFGIVTSHGGTLQSFTANGSCTMHEEAPNVRSRGGRAGGTRATVSCMVHSCLQMECLSPQKTLSFVISGEDEGRSRCQSDEIQWKGVWWSRAGGSQFANNTLKFFLSMLPSDWDILFFTHLVPDKCLTPWSNSAAGGSRLLC